MKVFLLKWGKGYIVGEATPLFTLWGYSQFTESNGFNEDAIAKISALEVNFEVDLTDLSGELIVRRIN